MKMIFSLMLLILVFVVASQAQRTNTGKPVQVIFDTDMGPDYDDVGAITLLHYYASVGKAKILATMASTKYERVGPVLSVFNTYFGDPAIPIGVPKGEASELFDTQKWSDTLVTKYPHALKSNAEAADAVKLYRKILATQADQSVVIITVGFFTNIAGLLQSQPDEYSDLTGIELVNRKVARMVSMAGKFPSGSEFNVEEQTAASRYVFEHWEKPILFSGYEIGKEIKSGLPLLRSAYRNNPAKDVYAIAMPKAKEDSAGRMSWDQTAVLVAINGIKPYYRMEKGKIHIAADGSNTWVSGKGGNHAYLVAVRPPKEVEAVVNKLMLYQPRG
jgi:pyrimidine-specific ribonucleoside hydrolase